jgi:hypothetical protein
MNGIMPSDVVLAAGADVLGFLKHTAALQQRPLRDR